MKREQLAQWILVSGVFFWNRIEIMTLIVSFLLLFNGRKTLFQTRVLKYMFVVFAVSLLATFWVDYTYHKVFQQMAMISLFILLYEQVFHYYRSNLIDVFRKFIKVSYWVSVYGILQFFTFLLIGINICEVFDFNMLAGYPALWTGNDGTRLIRIKSVAVEGGYLGTFLVPSLIYLFFYKDCLLVLTKKWQKYIILICGILTMSPLFFSMIIAIAFFLVSSRFRYFRKAMLVMCVIGGGWFVSQSLQKMEFAQEASGIEGIFMRVRDTYKAFTSIDDPTVFYAVNTSTGVLLSQFHSAISAPSRLIGTGIGTNSQNNKVVFKGMDDNLAYLELNVDDSYSLLIRMLSEMGFLGVFLYLWFIKRHFRIDNFINVCSLGMICCYMIRGGAYFGYGTIFVHFLYYYTSKFRLTAQ